MSSEERMLTALFASVSGSSRLFERLGGAEALHAVDRCMKRIARGVESFRGRVLRTTRDELTALFANPDDACQAAIAMQRRVADLPPASGVQLAIRVGFQHGPVGDDSAAIQGDSAATAECLADLAGPGQVLTTAETRSLLSPALQLSTRCLDELAVKGKSREQAVFEVLWLAPKAAAAIAVVVPPARTKERVLRLCVRYGGEVTLLDNGRPSLIMGRDVTCDVVIRDRRASRYHARIDWRGGLFVLSDRSTNGSFVTLDGAPELFLRCEELVLGGSGIISFAASASAPDADIAQFEYL